MLIVQNALPLAVFGVLAMAIVLGIAFAVTNHQPGGSIYDEIGRGGLLGEDEPSMKPGEGGGGAIPGSAEDQAEREREIRQMLGARSERRLARGEPALDLDAELAGLLSPAPAAGPGEQRGPGGSHPATEHDPALVEEVRQLVVARNERRARKGLEPFEVEAEVRRRLDELGG